MGQHPYVPETLELPGYVPNFLSLGYLLSCYGLGSLVVVSLVWFVSAKFRHLAPIERLLMCWWAFTGLTHSITEGYFVFNPKFYQKATPHYFAEVWKEYSKADSRFAGRDSAVLAEEGISAILLGPLCILAVYAIAMRKSYMEPLQLAICLGQLYAVYVYLITPWLDGVEYWSGPLYYWFHYTFLNYIWVVIPSLVALRSWRRIVSQFESKQGKKR